MEATTILAWILSLRLKITMIHVMDKVKGQLNNGFTINCRCMLISNKFDYGIRFMLFSWWGIALSIVHLMYPVIISIFTSPTIHSIHIDTSILLMVQFTMVIVAIVICFIVIVSELSVKEYNLLHCICVSHNSDGLNGFAIMAIDFMFWFVAPTN